MPNRPAGHDLAAVDPADPRVRELVGVALGSGAAATRDRLAAVVAADRDPGVRVAFGGHFSSGKSTLLNALLGRDLLPTGDFPETGVPCTVRAGSGDRVEAVDGAGRRMLPCTTAAIAGEVSLVDDAGEYSTRVHAVDRLLVDVTGEMPPPGVEWIDSPGINDTPAMDGRAATAAAESDALVWVVNAQQPLSEVEQAFLHRHVDAHGPAGVVFVVNLFLRSDTVSTWTRTLDDRAAWFRGRLADAALAPIPPPVLFVSARAAATRPDGFGLPELRSHLAGLTSAQDGRVVATRGRRAADRLTRLADELADRLAAERTRTSGQPSAREQERARQRWAFFRDQVRRRQAAAFANARDALAAGADAALRHRLRAHVVVQLRRELVVEVNRVAAVCGRERLTAAATSALDDALEPVRSGTDVAAVEPAVGAVLLHPEATPMRDAPDARALPALEELVHLLRSTVAGLGSSRARGTSGIPA